MSFDQFLADRILSFTTAFILIVTAIAYFGFKRRDVVSDSAIKNTLASCWMLFGNIALGVGTVYLTTWTQQAYDFFNFPHVPTQFWESKPLIVSSLAALIAKDFADYWNHRWMHMKWIWPVHAVHHSDTYVNGFTLFRVHMLEPIYMKMTYVFLLSWLGFPTHAMVVIFLLEYLHGAYVHMEYDIDHGPFNWLLASPRFHRWHHADNPAVFGKNLANHFPIYDMMFGTYYNPGRCLDPMGARSDDVPDHNALKLALLPITLWRARFSKSFGKVPHAQVQQAGRPNVQTQSV